MRAVFAPKSAGSAALASDLTCTPLSGGAIFFSSAAVLVGSAGQANYAAANAALDALADRMQAAGCPGTLRGYPWVLTQSEFERTHELVACYEAN